MSFFRNKPRDPLVWFQLPNAKINSPYVGKVHNKEAPGAALRVRHLKLPSELGLVFDETRGEVSGTPALEGEHIFKLQWSRDDAVWRAGRCRLFVNPDPRHLWKCLEPDASEPYPKPHLDSAFIAAPNHQMVAASRRGRSHEHAGSFRDDDFYLAHENQHQWSVMVVADGAGSAPYSRWGSKLAAHTFGEHLSSQLAGATGKKLATTLAAWQTQAHTTSQAMGVEFHYLFHQAGMRAVQALETEAQAKQVPFKNYATTLLAAAVRVEGQALFLATFWLGDGAIAAYGPRGKVRLMGAPDSGEFAGQTRFLDRAALNDTRFSKRIGIGRFHDIDGVVLMTDGVSDPKFETDTGLTQAPLWDAVWDEISPLLKSKNPALALLDWLHFFATGHHDDRTLLVLSPTDLAHKKD